MGESCFTSSFLLSPVVKYFTPTETERVIAALGNIRGLKVPVRATNPAQTDFKIWEHVKPGEDGLPYFDMDFMRSIEMTRREATESPEIRTTPGPSVMTAAPVVGTTIPFKNFSCNLLAQRWVCSNPTSLFCVFFAQAVPPATRIIVTPLTTPVVTKFPSDGRLLSAKCGDRLKVDFVSTV